VSEPVATGQPTGLRDHALGLALCLVYVAVLLGTASELGLARDEGMYVQAAEIYGRWLELLVREPSVALTQEAIDQAFRVNREHPPLAKLLFALGHLVQQKYGLFATESASYRFAGMLSAGLLLWLIYVFGTRVYERMAGLFAALAYALLPRPFYHAHLDAFDVPITLAATAVTYAYHRSLSDRRWALACGGLFGLALLTKHNSWILPGIFAIHFGIVAWTERRSRRQGEPSRISLRPYWLLALVLLGPLLFFGGWPFLWHDTFARTRWYVAFHLKHDYYNMEYFGVNYFWPPFPMSYAWVMTFFTVPLTTLSLGLMGTAFELKRTLRVLRDWLRARSAVAEAPEPTQTFWLLLGCMLAPLVLITVPSTPIFGGTKHWFPAYPFLALFAGHAFSQVVLAVRARFAQQPWVQASPIVLGVWLLAPAWVETAHSHPFGLSHYTVAAGGVPGAAAYGMNRQFWGFTTGSLAPYLRATLPNGGTVYLCDTIYSAWQMLIRDGHIPENIRATGDISQADLALVHHEKHFAEVDHQIWTTYGSVRPAHVLTYDGVPIISVYQNPRRR